MREETRKQIADLEIKQWIDFAHLDAARNDIALCSYKAGQSFNACVPFFDTFGKVHIEVILSGVYLDNFQLVYRVYGKHKQWWRYFICSSKDMDAYIEQYDKHYKTTKQ